MGRPALPATSREAETCAPHVNAQRPHETESQLSNSPDGPASSYRCSWGVLQWSFPDASRTGRNQPESNGLESSDAIECCCSCPQGSSPMTCCFAIALLGLQSLAVCWLPEDCFAGERPNIVFVFSEDHAFQAIGAWGSSCSEQRAAV